VVPEIARDEFFNSVHALPGGRAVLYTVRGGKRGAFVMAFDLRTRQEKIIVREGSDARYLPTGQLLYGVKGALHIVPFDLDRLEVAGTPVAVSDAVMTTPIGGMLNVDVSSDGTAVYVPSSAPVTGRKIVWVDRQGHEESTRMPVRAYTYPRFSPDGSRIAFDIRDQENDIWKCLARRADAFHVRPRIRSAATLDRGRTPYHLRLQPCGEARISSGKHRTVPARRNAWPRRRTFRSQMPSHRTVLASSTARIIRRPVRT